MKPNEKLFLKKNPYILLAEPKNFYTSRNSHFYHSESPEGFNKTIQNTEIKKNFPKTSEISHLSRSLKTVTLNSKLYSNYIDYYSTITQKNRFKIPKILEYPVLKNKDYLSIKLQHLTERDSSNEKILSSTDRPNSIFLSFLKETKPMKKVIEKKSYGFKYGKTKIRFERIKTDEAYKAGKDFFWGIM